MAKRVQSHLCDIHMLVADPCSESKATSNECGHMTVTLAKTVDNRKTLKMSFSVFFFFAQNSIHLNTHH